MGLTGPALHRAILAVDIEGFGRQARTNRDQVQVRAGLYQAMQQACARAGIPWEGSHHEDRGDGILVLIPPEVPKNRLSSDLPRELAGALTRHNRRSSPHAGIRLRMVLHAGEVHHDQYGVAGSCINTASRLLEAPGVKAALAGSSVPLVVVVSEWFFDEVVRHDQRSDPQAYQRIEIRVKETVTTAMLRLPGHSGPVRTTVARERPIWNVPRQNHDFVGRDRLIDRLAEGLESTGDVLTSPACVLHGMGGVGKSQLAREFAHRSRGRFDGVWWVDAGHPFSLSRDLTALADELGLPQDDTQHRFRLLWQELAGSGTWLLVYDNAEAEADLVPWWPATDIGAVVITSRTSSWRLAEPIRVHPFSREESITFLCRIAGMDRSDERHRPEVDQLAGELGDLPLALAQAAAYVSRNRTGWQHYSSMLRRAPARLMHLNKPDDYVSTAATTWSLSMTRVEEERPESADLLRLCAFLDSDRIPRDLLRPGVPGLPTALRLLVEDRVGYDLAVGALTEYALMDATPENLAVHPLVQTMIRESFTGRERQAWIRAAALQLDLCFPERPQLPDSWQDCTSLLPHVAAVARHARPDLAAPAEVSAICQRAAVYLEVRDQYEQALEFLEHALVLREHVFGVRSKQTAETLTTRGEAECYLGHHRTAIRTARSALAIWEQLTGPEHSSAMPTMRLLGRALTEVGRPVEAVGVLERAVEICVGAHGAEHPATAELLARLAYARWRGGDPRLARTTYEQAHDVWHATGSPPDRERTVAYRWHATVLGELGDLVMARTIADWAIRLATGLYGPDHVETVRAEETLGIILAASGDLAEGERLQRRAVRFLREFYPVPVVVAGTLTSLARTLLLADRPAEALAMAEEALDLYVGRHGTVDHVYNAGALTMLGMAHRRLGHPDRAAHHLTQARTIYERSHGPPHYLTEVLAELALCT